MPKKLTLLLHLLFCLALPASAQPDSLAPASPTLKTVAQSALKSFKAGGYIIGRYNYSDRSGTSSNGGFSIRLFRLYGSGYVTPKFFYRFQFEMSDAPGIDRGPRVLDAYVDYQPRPEVQVKLGQFKRPFGFENPLPPLEVGIGTYPLVTNKLQSLNDRIGEHVSSGRDVGIQLHGDLLPLAKHRLVHYQLGVYNGQGINHSDANRHKDLILGLSVEPLAKLQLGIFLWDGKFSGSQTLVTTAADGSVQNLTREVTLPRRRYNLGVFYNANWVVRAEYAHSYGGTLKGAATESDGWYAMVGMPTRVDGLKIYARWDAYRDDASQWGKLCNNYTLALGYWLNRNLLFQAGVAHTYDRSLPLTADRHYNSLDLQVAARF